MHRPLIASLGVISREIRCTLFYSDIGFVFNNWFSGLRNAWIIRLRSSGLRILIFDLLLCSYAGSRTRVLFFYILNLSFICVLFFNRVCTNWSNSLKELLVAVFCLLIANMQEMWQVEKYFIYLLFLHWEYAEIRTKDFKIR